MGKSQDSVLTSVTRHYVRESAKAAAVCKVCKSLVSSSELRKAASGNLAKQTFPGQIHNEIVTQMLQLLHHFAGIAPSPSWYACTHRE